MLNVNRWSLIFVQLCCILIALLWVKKGTNMITPFEIEFQPLMNDMNDCANAVRECADAATMKRVKGIRGPNQSNRAQWLMKSRRTFGEARRNGKAAQKC